MLSQRYFIPIVGFITLFGATDLAHANEAAAGLRDLPAVWRGLLAAWRDPAG